MKPRFYPFVAVLALALGLLTFSNGSAVTAPWDPFFATQTTVADFGATTRPFGVAGGDYNEDGNLDLVVGRTTGNVAFVAGNGDGTFDAPVVFSWKQAFFNAWSFAPADVNGDGNLDVVWGANAASSGCSISPIPTGQTCATAGGTTVTVDDGQVRAYLGNGDGTFAENVYFVSGVRHNGGILIGDIGVDAGSVATGDVDGDSDLDIVTGGVNGANSVVAVLRNDGGLFTQVNIISQPTATSPGSPVYFPATSTQNSPWGLAFGDADGDSDLDLWVGDRALYVYLYTNDGAGNFSLTPPATPPLASRPNAMLVHDTFRASVGFTPSLGAADINGDNKSDVVIGLHSGAQTPTACPSAAPACPNDGVLLLDVSGPDGFSSFGPIADIGTMARGVTVADVNEDGAQDVIAAAYEGQVKLLRQLPPTDTDSDGVSDYVDNAPSDPNAARLDMNTDASVNHRDQLDNDFDTVLGDPENPATWQRLGDPADTDDDNDGLLDGEDNCPFVANADQANADGDAFGDACDPLDNTDTDGDGVPDGPAPGDPLYDESLAAKIKWSQGDTHFVIRIDALGRFFQNEFTQIMTDAAILSPADWATKCWENYGPGGDDPADPCGTGEGTPDQALTLPGGKEVPVTVVSIPKQLWTDAPVVDWINDRNDNPLFELGQHGTYHVNNVPFSDWASLADRNFFSCEPCGLTEAENFEFMKIGYDTLLGNYANKWIAESGATGTSPKIAWSTSANPLITFSPPFNTSDTVAREAIAQLGFRAFTASVFEEGEAGSYGYLFSPEGSHHEQFDQFGMYHASADLELDPPDTTGDTYDVDAYNDYLQANTDDGGLTTWLIEEVEWSGRPCQNDDRLGTCNGGSNRENNTVYLPRWNAWMQLLDFVKNYPGGVAMTMGEVALAQGFDNAPTVPNADQADVDQDGIGDVIDGATMTASDATLSYGEAGDLSATLTNGDGDAISGQQVAFTYDADSDTNPETYLGTTDATGTATVSVTPTGAVGPASFTATWTDVHGNTATDTGSVNVTVGTTLTLDPANPASGQVTDDVTLSATLEDANGNVLPGRTVTFAVGDATATGTTDAAGVAQATLTLQAPAGATTASAAFAGDSVYGPSSDSEPFTVTRENTTVTLPNAVGGRTGPVIATATLTEADGAPLDGRTITFWGKKKGAKAQLEVIGTAVTNAAGQATFSIPNAYVGTSPQDIRAVFSGDASFFGTQDDATAVRVR